MSEHISVQTRSIDSFEEIDDSIRGAHIETVQLERGRLRGHLTHMSVGGLPVAAGAFSIGLRARGVLSDDRVTIAVLTGATGRVTQWSYETRPADVLVMPAGVDHDARFYSGASYAVISLDQADIDAAFATEPRLRELGTWPKRHFRAEKHGGEYVIRRLRDIIARLAAPDVKWNADAAEFWKQSIIGTMTTTILASTPSELDGPLLSAKRIVRKVEDYIEAAGSKPVHISELCREVHVSRRTLHRAFYEAVGIGAGRLSALPAAVFCPFNLARQRSGDDNDRRCGDAARLPESRQVFRLLPVAVRRIPVPDPGGIRPPDAPVRR